MEGLLPHLRGMEFGDFGKKGSRVLMDIVEEVEPGLKLETSDPAMLLYDLYISAENPKEAEKIRNACQGVILGMQAGGKQVDTAREGRKMQIPVHTPRQVLQETASVNLSFDSSKSEALFLRISNAAALMEKGMELFGSAAASRKNDQERAIFTLVQHLAENGHGRLAEQIFEKQRKNLDGKIADSVRADYYLAEYILGKNEGLEKLSSGRVPYFMQEIGASLERMGYGKEAEAIYMEAENRMMASLIEEAKENLWKNTEPYGYGGRVVEKILGDETSPEKFLRRLVEIEKGRDGKVYQELEKERSGLEPAYESLKKASEGDFNKYSVMRGNVLDIDLQIRRISTEDLEDALINRKNHLAWLEEASGTKSGEISNYEDELKRIGVAIRSETKGRKKTVVQELERARSKLKETIDRIGQTKKEIGEFQIKLAEENARWNELNGKKSDEEEKCRNFKQAVIVPHEQKLQPISAEIETIGQSLVVLKKDANVISILRQNAINMAKFLAELRLEMARMKTADGKKDDAMKLADSAFEMLKTLDDGDVWKFQNMGDFYAFRLGDFLKANEAYGQNKGEADGWNYRQFRDAIKIFAGNKHVDFKDREWLNGLVNAIDLIDDAVGEERGSEDFAKKIREVVDFAKSYTSDGRDSKARSDFVRETVAGMVAGLGLYNEAFEVVASTKYADRSDAIDEILKMMDKLGPAELKKVELGKVSELIGEKVHDYYRASKDSLAMLQARKGELANAAKSMEWAKENSMYCAVTVGAQLIASFPIMPPEQAARFVEAALEKNADGVISAIGAMYSAEERNEIVHNLSPKDGRRARYLLAVGSQAMPFGELSQIELKAIQQKNLPRDDS